MKTKHAFLTGKLLYLRALEEADLKGNYFQWFNDEEVCRHNSHAVFPNTEQKMKDYFASIQNKTHVVLAIIEKERDQHIGNISLQHIDWLSRSAEYAILIGEREYWGKGYALEASKLLMNYGFSRLNLHRIHCGTSSENTGMQNLAKKLGMKQEGIRKEAMFKNGKYTDLVEFGILNSSK